MFSKKDVAAVDLATSRSTYQQRKEKRPTGDGYGSATDSLKDFQINLGSRPFRRWNVYSV
jgi:hypothetical protein